MHYRKWIPFLAAACVNAGLAGFSAAQEMPPLPTACPDPGHALLGPVLAEAQALPKLPPAQPEATDKPLAINLATALRLAGARPLIIAAAEASVQVAAEQLAKARVEWLPAFNVGAGYYRHDGATQGQSGNFYINSKDQFLAGGGLSARVATTDALFAPLAARQILRSRQLDVQTARNDALLAAAESYFNVQQARGRLAAAQDVVDKNRALRKAVDLERLQQARPTDLHRALAQLANLEDAIASTREQWRLASVDLTQVLRLDPTATVVPLEPPSLLVTLISPKETVDALIPIGLTNRPELASQQALVQAALARIRQERMRPLIPSLILEGGPGSVGPGGYLMGGIFASGAAGVGNPSVGRDDVSVGLVWQMQNLGFGNRALVRERRAERQQLLVDLFRLQDLVAADVARAYAQIESATVRVSTAERGIKEARQAYEGSLAHLDELDKVGDVRVQVHRAFDVIDALKALSQAYDTYFGSVNDFNRAQFRLYRALGYPAGILACERSPGPILPVDTTRPPQMAPVCAPDPCPGQPCVKTSASGPKSSSR
jgi:outer membrane protein TolC